MCLAIPGKVIKIFDEGGLKMGHIDYSGTVNKACLEYVPEIKEGQYTLVHAGFALSILDEGEAQKSLETWAEMEDIIQMDEPEESPRKPFQS
ncbi:MAG: HypC/HybG/HupF family hydrogenase formation chaperone [FCB group bacterium]|nr:HypC/HybG/HupF family hydrogenase formation chaperone [FCB group bacterium]